MSLAWCRPDAPLRPLDWRWRVAALLVPTKSRRKRAAVEALRAELAGDPGVAAAVAHRGAANGTGTTNPDPAGAGAVELRDGDAAVRGEVEAWLLAGVGPAGVAERTGVPAAVVERYGELFFDVTDRLGQRSIIIHLAVRPWGHADPVEAECAFLRLVGYRLGPDALGHVLRHLRVPRPAMPTRRFEAFPTATLDEWRAWAEVRLLWLATWYSPDTDAERVKLLAAIGPRCVVGR